MSNTEKSCTKRSGKVRGKKIMSLIRILVCMVILLSNFNLLANGMQKIKKSQKLKFFQNLMQDGLKNLTSYATMPKKEKTLSAKDYQHIVTQFDWWLKKVLSPNYVPDKLFVQQNIKLFPANNRTRKEDLAFLSYEIEDKNYMIVQTGGLNARMFIFAYEPTERKIANVDEANLRVKNFLNKYINKKVKDNIPSFIMKEKQGIHVAEVKATGRDKKINYAKCFMSDKEICLSIQKISFEDTIPGREPMPNEWFSFWKNQEDETNAEKVQLTPKRRSRGRK